MILGSCSVNEHKYSADYKGKGHNDTREEMIDNEIYAYIIRQHTTSCGTVDSLGITVAVLC